MLNHYIHIMVFKICYFYISCDFTKKVGLLRKRYKNDKKTYKLPSHTGLKFCFIFWHQIFLLDDFQETLTLIYLKNWSEFVQAMVRVQKKYTFNFLGKLFNKRKIVALFLPFFGPLCVYWYALCRYDSCVSFISYEFFVK